MKLIHTPRLNARYWTAITLASVFGTNMGDLYAHESGLGIGKGLALLAVLTAIVFVLERVRNDRSEWFYWGVILLIRTGATNIADYLAYRARIPELPLTAGLTVLLILFGWATHRATVRQADPAHTLPSTNAAYWLAMLAAGVFGTVVGDICEHLIGEGIAALALTVLLLVVLLFTHARAARFVSLYWITVATARTAGTAIGDWLAEAKDLHIGLPLCTALSCIAFIAVVALWPTPPPATEHRPEETMSTAG